MCRISLIVVFLGVFAFAAAGKLQNECIEKVKNSTNATLAKDRDFMDVNDRTVTCVETKRKANLGSTEVNITGVYLRHCIGCCKDGKPEQYQQKYVDVMLSPRSNEPFPWPLGCALPELTDSNEVCTSTNCIFCHTRG